MGGARLALPDSALLGAGGLLELLVFLVLAGDEELKADHEEEQDGSNNGQSKRGLVQIASESEIRPVVSTSRLIIESAALVIEQVLTTRGRAVAQGSLDITAARLDTITGKDGNSDEACSEEKVENNCQQGEDADTADEAGQDDGEGEVDYCGTTDALNRLPFSGDGKVIASEDGQEVRIESEYASGTAECAGVEEGL